MVNGWNTIRFRDGYHGLQPADPSIPTKAPSKVKTAVWDPHQAAAILIADSEAHGDVGCYHPNGWNPLRGWGWGGFLVVYKFLYMVLCLNCPFQSFSQKMCVSS